jgi:hypothetical protein
MSAVLRRSRLAAAPVHRALPLERFCFRLKSGRALTFCWSMILPENRFPLFGIML